MQSPYTIKNKFTNIEVYDTISSQEKQKNIW